MIAVPSKSDRQVLQRSARFGTASTCRLMAWQLCPRLRQRGRMHAKVAAVSQSLGTALRPCFQKHFGCSPRRIYPYAVHSRAAHLFRQDRPPTDLRPFAPAGLLHRLVPRTDYQRDVSRHTPSSPVDTLAFPPSTYTQHALVDKVALQKGSDTHRLGNMVEISPGASVAVSIGPRKDPKQKQETNSTNP